MALDAGTPPARSAAHAARAVVPGAAAVMALACLAVLWRAAELRPSVLFNRAGFSAAAGFARGLWPPELSPGFLRVALEAAGRSLAMAISGTVLSLFLAFPLAVLATPLLWRRGARPLASSVFSPAARVALGILRAVPDLVWGLLFVSAVGLGPLAGSLALALSAAGVLGRVTADLFQSADRRALEGLQSVGATRVQLFLHAIWPQTKPLVVAYTVYSFECCVRAAAVLGFIGAGGLGQEIQFSMRLFEYGQVATLVVFLVGVVTLAEAGGGWARRGFLPGAARRGGPPQAATPTARPARRRESRFRALRWVAWFAALGGVALAFAGAGFFDARLLDAGLLQRAGRFAGSLFPPDLDGAFLRTLPTPILQTLGIATFATLLGAVCGGALAIPAARLRLEAHGPGRVSRRALLLRAAAHGGARAILSVLRSIPELLWVLVCLLWVGLGPFAGTLALALHTSGVLGKLYAEVLEEVPRAPLEALRATGAGRASIACFGLWPQARTLLASFTLLRWESNLRVSTVLGLVGGGGLGQALYNDIQLGFRGRTATHLLAVLALVALGEALGHRLGRGPRAPVRLPARTQLRAALSGWEV